MSLTCRIHGAKDLRLEQDGPAELGPTDVEMRLGAGGICGSDLHYYQHGRVGAFVVREPLVPGHEVSGTVARIGSAVTRVAVGDKVAINPSHACGHCDYCTGGRLNLCRHMRFLGSASVFPHVQGMFRERFVMGERQLTPIHEDISLGELACAEPLSIGLHAVHRAGVLTGKTVLVTGGGTIGSMSVIAARLAGAAHIICCDIADRPLQTARSVGADVGLRTDLMSDAELTAQLADSADACIEAAGSPAALIDLPEGGAQGRPHRAGGHAAGRRRDVPGQQHHGARARLRGRVPRRACLRLGGAVPAHAPRRCAAAAQRADSALARARSLRAGERPHAQHQGAGRL